MGVKVRRRRGDYWEVKIDHQGLRRTVACGRGKAGKKAAELAQVRIQAELAIGGVLKARPATPVLTLEEAGRHWLEQYTLRSGAAHSTLTQRRHFLEEHLVPFFGTRPLVAIDDAAIDELIAAKQGPGGGRRGKPLKGTTIRGGMLVTLRHVLDFAQRRGWIAANPLRGGVPFRPAPDSTAPEPDPFDQRELAALLAAAQEIAPRWALMVRCWAQSGLRSGEIRGLRMRDLDPQLGTVRVERTRSQGRTGRTKTRQSRRLVRLTHLVCEAAACEGGAWQYATTDVSAAVLAELTRVEPLNLEASLFPSLRDPQRPMDEGELRWLMERTLRRAKVRPRSPEQFRHTFVSTLPSRGAPPLYVASQSGHSRETMFRSYAKWIDQAEAVDARSMQPAATLPQPGLRPGAVTHQLPNRNS
jgi:integrase